MKKHTAKLAIRRNTLRALDIAAVSGGRPPPTIHCDSPSGERSCNDDGEGSHAPTCGECWSLAC